jgi:two-component system, sensor histidine kinase and response regulator
MNGERGNAMDTMNTKLSIIENVARAKGELEKALEGMETLPAFDPHAFGFAAHALNNYLTVARGTIGLLQSALKDHPDDDVKVWIDALNRATDMMQHTVGQLRGISHAAPPELIFERVNAPIGTRRACVFYQSIADRKGVRIDLDAESGPLYAYTDRVATAAILDNLLSNAVKYSPPGTTIRVVVRADDGRVVCSVSDEGPGLSREDQQKLFQRGVRLSTVPTGGELSTGYGLAVAKDLAVRLSGDLWCESEPGHGATFSLSLPRYSEKEHAAKVQ